MNKLIFGMILFASTTLFATGTSLNKQDLVGTYSGKTSNGMEVYAEIKNNIDDTRFEQVTATIDYEQEVVLGLDISKNEYRGFLSYQCDDPGCTQIYSLNIILKKDSKNQLKIYVSFDGYVEEGEEPGYDLKYTAELNKLP